MQLLRDRQPTNYEYDSNILKRVRAGEAQTNPDGGDTIINNPDAGVFGIVDAFESGNFEDRQTSRLVARTVEQSLANYFDADDPEGSMRAAFDSAQAAIQTDSNDDPALKTGVSVSALKIFESADGQMKFVYGSTGNQHIYFRANERIQLLNQDELDDDNRVVNGLGIPPNIYNPRQFGVEPLFPHNRIVILSSGVVGNDESEYMERDQMNRAMDIADSKRSALRFISNSTSNPDRSAVVIDVLDENEAAGKWWSGLRRRRQQNYEMESGATRRTSGLGRLSLLGATVGASTYMHDRLDGDPEPTVVVEERVVDEQDIEHRRRLKKILLVGAAAVSAALLWKYGFDHGQDIGPHADKGIDLWPFGDGDKGQGNGYGFDLNPFNDSNTLNDDSVHGAVTVAPPVEHLPEVVTPAPAPIAPPVLPKPPVWQPQMFNVEPGHGLIQEIHEAGHKLVGESFHASDAQRVYDSVTQQFGDNIINLPNHPGLDVYHYHQEARIAATGQAHWASQAIERAIQEQIKLVSKN